MPDTFTITLIFIVCSTFVAAFVRRMRKDKCLIDFSDNLITIELKSGKILKGKLKVESTGLELMHPEIQRDNNVNVETSTILYKYEYPQIQTLIRFHDELSEENKKERDKKLKKTYHPNAMRKLFRRLINIFKTVRDSITEVINILLSQVKKTASSGAVLTSQDKYVSQMKQDLMDVVGTAYEPLLEKYIGRIVVLELSKGDKIVKCSGILKDYTAEFIEIMDVSYVAAEGLTSKAADIVMLRKDGVVRHVGE